MTATDAEAGTDAAVAAADASRAAHRRVAAAVVDLPGVDLATLNASAALQTRTDRKYVIDGDVAVGLLEHLADRGAVLDIDGRRAFRYETTYFDTPDLRFYRDTANRRPLRYKVRIRRYLDSDLSMLEIKAKDRRGRTVKHRMALTAPADRGRLGSGAGLPASAVPFVVARCPDAPVAELAATMTTRFRRTTVVGTDRPDRIGAVLSRRADDVAADFRVTVDTDLRFLHVSGRTVELDRVIVESKSASRASVVDRWLWSQRVRPEPLSKYCTSMAALHPDLPSNHWHRTLRRYF